MIVDFRDRIGVNSTLSWIITAGMLNYLCYISTKRKFTISRCFPEAGIVEKFGCSKLDNLSRKVWSKNIDEALKILDLVDLRAEEFERNLRHRRLIQGCMQELLDVAQESNSDMVKEKSGHGKPMHEKSHNAGFREYLKEENSVFLLLELHKRGISADMFILASAMSSCVVVRAFGAGLQLHTISVKNGYDAYIPLGSSLISLYAKIGQLGNAYRVFQLMPMFNVITWTSIISGYAQHGEAEACLQLLLSMRRSMVKPNDITFASVFSACRSIASLLLGQTLHCLEIKMGFDTYTHVSNAIISMYAKCGDIDGACYVFCRMQHRDLISWNSMISAVSQYGLAEQAMELLKEMHKQNVVPDAVSYLSVLSSCRHAGHVYHGRLCFRLMHEQELTPELDHYSCMVDLLGRSGLLEEALDFIEKMPISPNAVIWGSLLASCKVHGNIWLGIHAAENRLLLEPGCAATYIQLASLYASVGYWNDLARIRKLMKERRLKTNPGYSWIEIGSRIYNFKVEDGSNCQLAEILGTLDNLVRHMVPSNDMDDLDAHREDYMT